MHAVVRQTQGYHATFGSLGALCDTIETSKQGGAWLRYGTAEHASLDAWKSLGTLDEALWRARTLQGHAERVQRIETLAAGLTAHVPAPASVRRQPTWGRQGHGLSVNKVLAGNLSTCWRTTTRVRQPQHGKIITFCLPTCFSYSSDATQIEWTIAASLAYALLAQQAGYGIDLWASSGIRHAYADDTHLLVMTQLKAAGAPWNTANVAPASAATFLRRFIVRLIEQGQPQLGERNSHYGAPMDPAWLAKDVQIWAQRQGLNCATLHYGASERDAIDGPTTARAWLAAALKRLG